MILPEIACFRKNRHLGCLITRRCRSLCEYLAEKTRYAEIVDLQITSFYRLRGIEGRLPHSKSLRLLLKRKSAVAPDKTNFLASECIKLYPSSQMLIATRSVGLEFSYSKHCFVTRDSHLPAVSLLSNSR